MRTGACLGVNATGVFFAGLPEARATCPHSPWDKPNCRAMRVGVMPALKAARTAFSCPRVKDRRFHFPVGAYRSEWCLPSFRLSERYGEQTVQFFIIEMLDGVRQVLGQDMPSRIR